MPKWNVRLALAALPLVGLCLFQGAWIAARTVFPPTIALISSLPPLVEVRASSVNVRLLPNDDAPALAAVDVGDPLYLRCSEGSPLMFGPWLGVLDPKSDAVGWVNGHLLSESAGACPAGAEQPPQWRLRKRRSATGEVVNVRFGPSSKTLTVGKLRPGARAWTDGRFVELEGYRWVPVLLESGATGWVRGDLIL